MNIKEEDVFLIVLEQGLIRTREKELGRDFADDAQIALDATKEIMSVVGKVSKSSSALFPPK